MTHSKRLYRNKLIKNRNKLQIARVGVKKKTFSPSYKRYFLDYYLFNVGIQKETVKYVFQTTKYIVFVFVSFQRDVPIILLLFCWT